MNTRKAENVKNRKTEMMAVLAAGILLLVMLFLHTDPVLAADKTDSYGNQMGITGTLAAGKTLHITAVGKNQELYTEDPAEIPGPEELPDGTRAFLPDQLSWQGTYGSGDTVPFTPADPDMNAPAEDSASAADTPLSLPREAEITPPHVGKISFTATFRQYQLVTGDDGTRTWQPADPLSLKQSLNLKGTVVYKAVKGSFKEDKSSKTKYYKEGAKATGRPTPTARKYFFLGWYTKKSGGREVTKATTIKFGKRQKITYYAHWEKLGTTSPIISYKGKNASSIPVITYHRVVSASEKRRYGHAFSSLIVTEGMFRQQMKWLHNHHYTTLSMDEFYLWHQGKIKVPKKSVVITFDDGMYCVIKYALPVLKKYKMKATMFMIGKSVPRKTNKRPTSYGAYHTTGRDVIKYVKKKYPNFEFQSHTWGMHVRAARGNGYARTKSYAYQKADFKKMYKKFGYTYLAYPFGHYTDRTIKAAKAGHIKMAFAYGVDGKATRSQGRYTIRRIKIDGNQGMSRFTRWF